jgi:hypothetical protein
MRLAILESQPSGVTMKRSAVERELEPGMTDRAIVAAQHKLFSPPQSFFGADWCDGPGGYL